MTARDQARLAKAAEAVRIKTAERDRLIGVLHDQGLSLRQIGEIAKLSHTAVRKILRRTTGPGV